MGAGLGTGFAGMSAAAVVTPMLVTFLGMPAYEAVGIALASDVLASAVSAYTYGKNKNLDIKNGLIMMVSVLVFTVVGSYVSKLVPNSAMGGFSVCMTFLLGIKFIVKPVMTTKEKMESVSPKKRVIQSIVCGVLIGFICGFIGAGGGMIAVPFLKKCGLSQKQAQATAICVILPLTVLSAAVYLLRGYFRLWDAAPFILFGFPGTLLGTVLLSKMKNSLLQSVFSLFMLWAGFRLVVG